jgi:hypothetical protein
MTERAISLAEIRTWTALVLDAFEQAGIKEIPLARENYWTVFFDEAFQVEEPTPSLGALSDDVETLRATAKGDDGDALWHVAYHLQGILTLLAAEAADRSIMIEGLES